MMAKEDAVEQIKRELASKVEKLERDLRGWADLPGGARADEGAAAAARFMYVCIIIYIYIERDREREIDI